MSSATPPIRRAAELPNRSADIVGPPLASGPGGGPTSAVGDAAVGGAAVAPALTDARMVDSAVSVGDVSSPTWGLAAGGRAGPAVVRRRRRGAPEPAHRQRAQEQPDDAERRHRQANGPAERREHVRQPIARPQDDGARSQPVRGLDGQPVVPWCRLRPCDGLGLLRCSKEATDRDEVGVQVPAGHAALDQAPCPCRIGGRVAIGRERGDQLLIVQGVARGDRERRILGLHRSLSHGTCPSGR